MPRPISLWRCCRLTALDDIIDRSFKALARLKLSFIGRESCQQFASVLLHVKTGAITEDVWPLWCHCIPLFSFLVAALFLAIVLAVNRRASMLVAPVPEAKLRIWK